jgi:two-component system nitrogen regulation sensor histidine kinase NtrY
MNDIFRLLRKLRWVLAATALLLILLIVVLTVDWSGNDGSSLSNILVFALVNLNVMALVVLGFIVGRNVVKLIFERRRGILGAKLRARLMVAFVLIAGVPITLTFIVSSGLIGEAMNGWFSDEVETAVTSAVTIARQHLASVKVSVRAASDRIERALEAYKNAEAGQLENLQSRLEDLRYRNDLYAVRIVERSGAVIVESAHATAGVESFKEPDLDSDALRRAQNTEPVLRVEERGASQFVRCYEPFGDRILVVSHRMDPDIVQAQGAVSDSFAEYEQLKSLKHPLKSNFVLTLALFNLLTIFGAIWVAFFISKQITGPIQKLAEGTRSVAKGDYDFALEPARDDEVGFLVNSFNQMLRDLRASRDEAERRGILIETILSNLAVGVIALDTEMRVTTVNSAAAAMLQIDHINFSPGVPLTDLLSREDFQPIAPLLASLVPSTNEKAPLVAEVECTIHCGGRELLVLCTAGRIVGSESECLGFVLIFDDITELSRAQHLAAWRDVARRIAHEIKNPLTPIQLSAQRLEKLLSNTGQLEPVEECTRTIVEHVAIIKRLANEFSEYGRMPTAQFVATDLQGLLVHTLGTFRTNYPDVEFQWVIASKLPEMLLDPEQIRGVVVNLLDNAVAAVAHVRDMGRSPLIRVQASFDRRNSRAVIEVDDNGPGVSATDKNRIFQPYFTTKKGGTGLGLAIVSSVISDHQGEIRIFDNHPFGTRFVINLPQHPQHTTVRRLGASSGEI